MPRPYHSVVIPAPIEDVWKILQDFGDLAGWHPAVKDSSLARGCSGSEVSAQRTFTLVEGGAKVREEIYALDNRFHTLVFAVVEGPFPVKDYVATIRLNSLTDTGETFAEWWAEFDADLAAGDEIAEAVKKTFFVAGLGSLQKRFAK